jgi:ABC-type transport system substrate-binding protein
LLQLVINRDKPPFNNPELRRAMSLSIKSGSWLMMSFIIGGEKGPATSNFPAINASTAVAGSRIIVKSMRSGSSPHNPPGGDCDALVAPTTTPAWKIDLVNGDALRGSSAKSAALAGYPLVTIPAGHVMGLPVGITVHGPRLE